MNIYTITEAAEKLNSTRDRIWQLIVLEKWKPRFFKGNSYLLDDSDLDVVAKLLKERSKRKKAGAKPKHLADPDEKPTRS